MTAIAAAATAVTTTKPFAQFKHKYMHTYSVLEREIAVAYTAERSLNHRQPNN